MKANKGAAGVDRETIAATEAWLADAGNMGSLLRSLHEDAYEPQPVRGVEIPSDDAHPRQLGIPTVRDRLVQQMLVQALEPFFEPSFSDSSYGFRPGRSTHDALRAASEYVADGFVIAVDIDLKAFFDEVNHDVLMSRLARRIGCRVTLRLIRRFLQAGLMQGGVASVRSKGTPQGGPLSPLLSNILLDECDRELDRRGHRFVRYADDLTIFVGSKAAGERVMTSVTRLLEGQLRLRVNREKSAVEHVRHRTILGYRVDRGGRLQMAPSSLKRCKDRVRRITRRNRGARLDRVPPAWPESARELRDYLLGWVTYFRLADCKGHLQRLDEWLRHRLRCYRLKQCKRGSGIRRFLRSLGVPARRAWALSAAHASWWRRAGSPPAHEAMTATWFATLGLPSLATHYLSLRRR